MNARFVAPLSLFLSFVMPQPEAARADQAETVVGRSGEYQLSLEAFERAIAERPPELRGGIDAASLEALARRLLEEELLASEARGRSMHLGFAHRSKRDRHVVQTLFRERVDDPLLEEPISDKDVEAYYEANRAEFERPEQRRAAHILVGSEERARELIELVPRLSAAEIREIIRLESRDDRTRLSAGDLRFFDRAGNAMRERDVALHPAIAEAAFELNEVGDVSPEPIAVDGNYSVLILRGIRPERRPGWEAARARIEAALHAARREAALKAFARALYEEIPIAIDELLLEKLRFLD